jgi:polyhydroxyalkanoate synthesis regulator protein
VTDNSPRIIKRYANRKLYDTVNRCFTTVGAVAELVAAGINVIVEDHDTGADRTKEVLAQAIGRQARSNPIDLGADLLASLLRAPVQDTVPAVSGEVEELRKHVQKLTDTVTALMKSTGLVPDADADAD